MLIPTIVEEMKEVGGVLTSVKKFIFRPSHNAGPYQICKECIEERNKDAEYKARYRVHGSSRCLEHSLNGRKDKETVSRIERLEEINKGSRIGSV